MENVAQFVTLFRTSIYKHKIENSSAKQFFLKLLKNSYKNNNKEHISNVGGFQTQAFHTILNKEIEKQIFLDPCYNFLNCFNKRDIKKNLNVFLNSYWINKNNNSDYNLLHNHLPNNFSGIWYLKTKKNQGRLVFQNADMTIFNENNFSYFDDNHFYSRFFLNVEENDLILFPSHMFHYVEPNKTNTDRISLAFNLTVSNI
jgi:uncharacterized protein (TIGR02466 family)